MQELMQTVLSKTKVILILLICCAFNLSAQQVGDVSLKVSVEPSTTMYPGQQGVMFFEVANNSSSEVSVTGRSLAAMQADGNNGYSNLIFSSTTAETTEQCRFIIEIEPITYTNPLFPMIFSIPANETKTCRLNFSIPDDATVPYTIFNYRVTASQLTETDIDNNKASVRINIKKRVRSVPVLNIWGGFALLLALMVAARQRYKKGI